MLLVLGWMLTILAVVIEAKRNDGCGDDDDDDERKWLYSGATSHGQNRNES